MAARKRTRGTNLAALRKRMAELPGVTEGTSYGTPAWRVSKKLIARINEEEAALALKVDEDALEGLMASDPRTFYQTPHYEGYAMVLVKLERIAPDALMPIVTETWRRLAPKRAVAAFDAGSA